MANIKMNISQVNADFQAIKNKIKDYTEVADGTRTSEYANKVDEVYEAGQSSMVDESKIIPKTVSGNPVVVQDVSEIPHDLSIQLISDAIADFSGIEVVRQGANLIPQINEATGNSFGIDWVRNADNSITLNGIGNGGTTIPIVNAKKGILFKKGTYTISGNSETTGNVRLWARGINNGTVFGGTYNNTPTTFTLIEDSYIYFYITVNVDTVVDNLTIYPQLNGGSSATPYEPYTEPIIATANASGVVEGLKSISPVTHLYSNADVDIELTYNKSWGMDYENRAFWNVVTNNGERKGYEYGFDNWRCEYIRPPYKIAPTSRTIAMFRSNQSLLAIEKEYFDLSNCSTSDTGSTNGLHNTFAYCDNLKIIEDINIPAGYMHATFKGDAKLETIEKLKINKTTLIPTNSNAPFQNCYSLKNITIEGEIGKSIDFQWCPLSKASITNIIEHLCADTDITGQTLTLKLTAVQKAFETSEGVNDGDTSAEWIDLITPVSNDYNGYWKISLI